MKVLYDYQIFQMQNYGGISRYFAELIKSSQKLKLYSADLALLISSNDYLSEPSFTHNTFNLHHKFYKKAYRFSNIINKTHSRYVIRNKKYDILHPTFYETYFLPKLSKPFVVAVYDLINEMHPEYFQKNEEMIARKRTLMNSAQRVIAISEHTKQDIIKYYKIPESKIDVTYLAESLSSIECESVANLPERYILFVGNRGGYKNFKNFFAAIHPLLSKDKSLNVLCAGGGPFNSEELASFQSAGLINQVVYQSFKSNDELKYIYSQALCFVFPSLYEGFGIPLLESFSAQCVACVSYSSSLKEIGGEGALYFDPLSVDDMRACIQKAIELGKNNIYTERALVELKKFSWDNTCRETLKVYQKC